jgi:hypothetical protein
MGYRQGSNTSWSSLPQSVCHVRMRCLRCGHTTARRAVPMVQAAFGADKPQLPVPPKRCQSCSMRFPAVDYLH